MFSFFFNKPIFGLSETRRILSTTTCKIITGITIFGLIENHWNIKEYRLQGSVEGQKAFLNGLRAYQAASSKKEKIIATHEIREGMELINRVSSNTSVYEKVVSLMKRANSSQTEMSYRNHPNIHLTYMEQQAQVTLLKLEQAMGEKFDDQSLRSFIDDGKLIMYAFRPIQQNTGCDINAKSKLIPENTTSIPSQQTKELINKEDIIKLGVF